MKKIILGIGLIIITAILIAGCSQEQSTIVAEPLQEGSVELDRIEVQQETLHEQIEEVKETQLLGCDAFPDKLDTCEVFSCDFEHPFTGEQMNKEITELKNGICKITEQMPNNGQMDCAYSISLRKAIAQYHRDLAVAESLGTSVSFGEDVVDAVYTIDGKEVVNPLQEAMESGACIISGY